MTVPLSDEQLEAMQRELEARRSTAEQEIIETEHMKHAVQSRQSVVSKFASSLATIRADNHFGENYQITMRMKSA